MARAARYSPAEQAAAKNSVIMPRHEIDQTDLKLLVALQKDGRLTNVELSRLAGITAPPCLRRVRTLEEKGVIRGYHADVEPKKLGFHVVAFAHVGLVSQADSELRAFMKLVREWRIVREAYSLQGEVDYLLKCVTRDLTEFQTFVTGALLTTPNVQTVKTSVLIDTVKREAGVPLGGA